jgi:hypothetical protein
LDVASAGISGPSSAVAFGRCKNTVAKPKVARAAVRVASLHSRAVDPFAGVLLGGMAALILSLWLLGKYYPGSGLEQVGLRSAREISETREALEAEDLDQMLIAHNARRRARGEAEVTVADLELGVMEDLSEQHRRVAPWHDA